MCLQNFNEHERHAEAVMERWRSSRHPWLPFFARLKRKRAGCQDDHNISRLEKRLRRIYPRGKAFERMVDLEVCHAR